MKFLIEGMDCKQCRDDLKLHKNKMPVIKNIQSDGNNLIVESYEDVSSEEILENILMHLEHIGHNHYNLKIYENETIILKGLTCANCTLKIEEATRKVQGVRDAKYDFRTEKYNIVYDNSNSFNNIYNNIKDIVNRIEPDVKVFSVDNIKRHDNINSDSNESIDVENNYGIELENESSMSRKSDKDLIKDDDNTFLLKKNAFKYLFSILMLIILNYINFGKLYSIDINIILYFILYIITARKVLDIAFKNIKSGEFLDENFLMSVASISAFLLGEYPEAVAVMLLYNVGEDFENLALQRSRKSISAALALKPEFANLVKNNKVVRIDPSEVNIGDIILVKPGEKVPLDGVVIEGESFVNTAEITGESVPKRIKVNDKIISGYINNESALKIKVETAFDDSTISKILDLVENASARKAPIDRFITRFAKIYTPVVVSFAVIMLIVPPFMGWLEWKDALFRACTFLVISCPCALVISVPLGIFSGIGLSSKNGIFVKGGNYLEAISELSDIVFDKTGTVTKGVFEVVSIYSDVIDHSDLLKYAAYGEYNSTHPIGKAILKAYNKEIDFNLIKEYKEYAGKGISYRINDNIIYIGNEKFLRENDIEISDKNISGTKVFIASDNNYLGNIVVSDVLKDNIKNDLDRLKDFGIKLTMLSGDNTEIAKSIAEEAGIENVYGDLMPTDKVEKLEEIISKSDSKVAFVGDGVNDAPVIARADVGFAMGSAGADAAVEAADIVIMKDEISKVADAIEISKYTKRIVIGNIIFALGVKFSVLILGVLGYASMWAAVFADVGVTILCILNSIRILNKRIK